MNVLNEYLKRKIIQIVPNLEESSDNPIFYLPHHMVFKQASVYTKCRIVFYSNSHHEAGQLLLNDCLDASSISNPNSSHLLIFFSLNKIALFCWYRKSFFTNFHQWKRQGCFNIPVCRWQSCHQWCVYSYHLQIFTPNMWLKLKPILPSATIKQHLSKFETEHPVATDVFNDCIYVDYLITGTDTVKDAVNIS